MADKQTEKLDDRIVVQPWQAEQVKISLEHWKTMQDLRQWSEALERFNISEIYRHLVKMVVAWPYEFDPGELASYDQLTPDQFGMVFAEAQKAGRAFFLATLAKGQ